MNIKTKILSSFIPVTLITLILTSLISYLRFKESLTSKILQHLDSVASIQKSRIESIIAQNHQLLGLISSRMPLKINLRKYQENGRLEFREKMNTILIDANQSISSFKAISVLNYKGVVVASTEIEEIGENLSDHLVFIQGQKENKVDYLFLNKDQNLMAHFSGPLRLNGAFLGVVLVTSHLKNLIAAVQDYSGLGRTGETVLGKRDDKGKIIFLAPLRFNQDAVLKNISLDTHFAVPMNETLSGKEKVMPDSVDYRGEAVLAITKYIDSVQWGLVVKIDRSEAFSTIVRLRNELYGLVAFSLVCAILIAFYLAKNIVEPI